MSTIKKLSRCPQTCGAWTPPMKLTYRQQTCLRGVLFVQVSGHLEAWRSPETKNLTPGRRMSAVCRDGTHRTVSLKFRNEIYASATASRNDAAVLDAPLIHEALHLSLHHLHRARFSRECQSNSETVWAGPVRQAHHPSFAIRCAVRLSASWCAVRGQINGAHLRVVLDSFAVI